MTGLFVLPISEAEKIPDDFRARFFPQRMERAARFLRHEDLLRSVAAGALVSGILGANEEDIALGPHGKPYLREGGTKFSLSHSGNYALLAVSENEVGADIEKLDPFRQREKVAKRVFTPEEQQWMQEAPETRFYMLWTMKESVMKLDGRGFSLPPESFSALPLLTGGTIETVFGTAYGKTATLDTCVLSVCTLHPAQDTPVRVLTAEALLETAGRSSLSEGQSSPSR